MPTRRLVTHEEVQVWGEALRQACLGTVEVAARTVTGNLAAHGLSWGDPVGKTSAVLLPEATWAKAVESTFVPRATTVADSILKVVKARINPKAQVGMRSPLPSMAAIATQRMLTSGVILNQRMTGGGRRRPARLTAAGNIMSIRDALDDAAGALGGLSARTGNQMANAAASAVAIAADERAAAEIMQIWETVGDDRVRVIHEEMEGQTQPVGSPFEDGDGNLLMYPGDSDAPDETVENCRCWLEVQGDDSLFNESTDYPAGGNPDAISSALDDALDALD